MHNLKEAIEIVLDLLSEKKTVDSILIEKRIVDIVGSFNAIKSDETAIQSWLTNDYPKQVIEQDLLKIMRQRKLDISEEHHKLLH